MAETSLRELPPLLLLNLRGNLGAEEFKSAVAGVLGVSPPAEPNTLATSGETAVLWLGPDEWLVTMPAGNRDLAERLGAALAGQHHSVVDVSQGRLLLELEGASAQAVLAQGTGLDLRPRNFGPGRCAQTTFAHVPVVLQQVDATPRFRIFVRASFAPFVTEWLKGAVAEAS